MVTALVKLTIRALLLLFLGGAPEAISRRGATLCLPPVMLTGPPSDAMSPRRGVPQAALARLRAQEAFLVRLWWFLVVVPLLCWVLNLLLLLPHLS